MLQQFLTVSVTVVMQHVERTYFSELDITCAIRHELSQVRDPRIDLVTSPSLNYTPVTVLSHYLTSSLC